MFDFFVFSMASSMGTKNWTSRFHDLDVGYLYEFVVEFPNIID